MTVICFFCTSRKRSAKSAKDDKHADPEEVDPGTLIAADDGEGGVAGLLQDNNNAATKTKGKKGKKKGKKKKMTKSEKDLVCSWNLCWLCECLLLLISVLLIVMPNACSVFAVISIYAPISTPVGCFWEAFFFILLSTVTHSFWVFSFFL